MIVSCLLSAIIGFLVGSIPTGYWLGRTLRGVDVRQFGSGNLGATNVFRVLGWKAGAATLFIDTLKGYLAVMVAPLSGDRLVWIGGIFAILGHSFSPFVRFKGGKGVATAAGVFLALMPLETGIAVAVFGIVFAVSRIVSLSSIIACLTLAVATLAIARDWRQTSVAALVAVFVILRHRTNIVRLMNGTEQRLSFCGKKAS